MKIVSVLAIVLVIGLLVGTIGYAATERSNTPAETTPQGQFQTQDQYTPAYGPGMMYGYSGYGHGPWMMGRGYARGYHGRSNYDGGSYSGYCPGW